MNSSAPSALPARLYLASQSPRRSQLLQQIGVPHTVLVEMPGELPDPVTEAVYEGESATDYVVRVTREKLQRGLVLRSHRNGPMLPVLAADTTVACDQKILGKPSDMTQACAMLRLLSGRSHEVLTSVALADPARPETVFQIVQHSTVRFGLLSEALIEAYCASGEPFDKAGGYGIQGLAAMFIAHLDGSHSGVMGLPLFETAALLQQAGLALPALIGKLS